MTLNEALKTITILKERNDLSLEEICKGFQIALALFDESLITFFKERYYHFLRDIILDIALHINEPEKIELFKQYQNAWEKIGYSDSKISMIAIMNKSKQCSIEADILVGQLKNKYVMKGSFWRNQFLMLLEKNMNELITSYVCSFEEEMQYSANLKFFWNASQCNDMQQLQEALEKAKQDKHETANLLRKVALIESYQNVEQALKTVSSITNKWIKEFALYDIAKYIYGQDPLRAKAIVSGLPTELQYGFRAFLSSLNSDEKEIVSTIKEIEKLNKARLISNDCYDDSLMSIAYSVAEKYPYLVLNIGEQLNSPWGERYSIEIEIAVGLSKYDLEESIAYLLKRNEDFFQIESIVKIIESVDDVKALNRLAELTEHYSSNYFKYRIIASIHKKIPFCFEQLWNITSKIVPYDL